MLRRSSCSRCVVAVALAGLLACDRRANLGPEEAFTFAVLDVGQGLAQLGSIGGRAIMWDAGPELCYDRWTSGYTALSRPGVQCLVLSHTDEDHRGGLARLDPSLDFSGIVVVSPFADTALVRQYSGAWSDRVRFVVKSQGDTVGGLEGVLVECIWPPADSQSAERARLDRNRYSLCFAVTHGSNVVMICSDIDTAAENALAAQYQWRLKADVLVVPHHGSRASVEPVFFGYVSPSYAIVSCARDNPYGHPSPEALDLLFQMEVDVMSTPELGHVYGSSNGLYWTWRGAGR